MADRSAIEWTDATWNPVTGCTEVSPGCDHCYAKTFAERWRGKPGHYFQNGFDVQLRPAKLALPLSWRKPRKVFVNSMSDLFHDSVPDEYIAQVFAVMAATPRHTYQLLTKRHGRMRSLLSTESFRRAVGIQILRDGEAGWREEGRHAVPSQWPLPNVWPGVSVENQQWADIRVPALQGTPGLVPWLSCEPLLGPVLLCTCEGAAIEGKHFPLVANPRCPLHGDVRVGWVVAGGESGPGARPMHPDWVRSLRDQCVAAGVPFLFKHRGQWTWSPQLDSPGGFIGPDGELRRSLPRAARLDRWYPVWRVGKHAAGRTLDGRTWDQYPEVVS